MEKESKEKYVVIRDMPTSIDLIAICDTGEKAFEKAWAALSKVVPEIDEYTAITEETENRQGSVIRLAEDETGETVGRAVILIYREVDT